MFLYDNIIVDVMNYCYRKKSVNKVDLLRAVVSGLTDEVIPRVKLSGKLHLLFDPIPKNDLGISKTFTYTGFRREILPDYKSNRIYDPAIAGICNTVLKYFSRRGEKVLEYYSTKFEADDYVEGIVNNLKGSAALLSNDLDWARYISGTRQDPVFVELINNGWDIPYTIDEFYNTFQFKPTIAANTVYKAIFGDSSDHIIGCINIKKAKFSSPIKILARDVIQEISNSNQSLDEFLSVWKGMKYLEVLKKPDKTPLERFYSDMVATDQKSPVIETFEKNIQTIRCAIKTVEDFKRSRSWQPENPSFNEIIHKSIYGVPFNNKFGKV
jgi:hypothetical protein